MHQAESSSSLSCLWTGHSLPAALHPVSRQRSCLRLRTDQCFCPIGTFTLLLVRTFRRTIPGTSCLAAFADYGAPDSQEFAQPPSAVAT
jgi:hypothetical protein